MIRCDGNCERRTLGQPTPTCALRRKLESAKNPVTRSVISDILANREDVELYNKIEAWRCDLEAYKGS